MMRVETEHLNKTFEGIKALDDVSVDFEPGMVTAIIGPNGAGKTTLFNVISGFLQPDSGHVYLKDGTRTHNTIGSSGTEITDLRPDRISQMGIGVLFQDIRVFGRLSVLGNVLTAAREQPGEDPLQACFTRRHTQRVEAQLRERAMSFVEYVGLTDQAHHWAEQLSYGQQKLTAIARLLMSGSKVLLLDEPTSGVNPEMIPKLLHLVQLMAERDGHTVLMIEHNLNVVREVGNWVYLMARGAIEVFGVPAEVLQEDSLMQVFPNL